MGDRISLIGRAVALLSQRLEGAKMYLSSYVESEPWGYDSSNQFLNRGVLVILDHGIDPHGLLKITQEIEKEIGENAPHRNPDGSYCDRPIDIDIIDIDGMRLDTPDLVLPHPRAHLRPFVYGPMEELNRQSSIVNH